MADSGSSRRKQRVKRYWPGRVPHFVDESAAAAPAAPAQGPSAAAKAEVPEVAHVVESADVAEIITAADLSSDEEPSRRRERSQPRDESEDEEDIDARRARARARAQQASGSSDDEEEPEADKDDAEEGIGSSGESSEWETDTSDEEDNRAPMYKPVFVKRNQRATLKEREQREKEKILAEEKRLERRKERRAETRQMVEEDVRREEELERGEGILDTDAPVDRGDDRDGLNEEEEFNAWKQREIARIRRDMQERMKFDEEKRDIERRRNMTDEEIAAENRQIKAPKEKKKMKFLQKYFHKGAFFQETNEDGTLREEIYNRELNNAEAATGEDKFDKSRLPEVMQVREGIYGRRGGTKWTHLSNEDTSKGEELWNAAEPIRGKERVSAVEDSFSRPRKGTR